MNTDAWGHPGTVDGNPGHTSTDDKVLLECDVYHSFDKIAQIPQTQI